MSDSYSKYENEPLNRSLLTEGNFILKEPIDVTNCEKEPIHIPGRIQPHGVLLAVSLNEEHKIVQASLNVREMLGLPAEKLIGTAVADLIGQDQLDKVLQRNLKASITPDLQYMDFKFQVNGEDQLFVGVAHESEGLIILELEPNEESGIDSINDFNFMRTFFGRIKQTANRREASQAAAEQVKEMLGYDRVMIYEFDEEWNGKVIAEAKEDELEPYLGHHYPASDIPKQARELYLRNWLRTIVDVNYVPVDIVPTVHSGTGRPLNLSLSVLRSVSPMHIEYLKNMGVGATVTISLIHDNQLWGMITCHHRTAKYISHRTRNLCNFLGSFYSDELYQRQQLDDYQAELQLKKLATRIADIFSGHASPFQVQERLHMEQNALLDLMSASGAAVSYQDKLLLFGETPLPGEVRELGSWLAGKAVDFTYHTHRLSLEYDRAKAYKDKASGVIFLALSPGMQNYILWFRPEMVQVVDWAGDPAKAVLQEGDSVRLSPRKSFEKWRQVVQSTAVPWKQRELSSLPELKSVVRRQSEEQMRQAEEQALQNARVYRQNEQRYLQLMEYSSVAFFTLSGNDITYCNNEAAELLGAADASQLLGRPLTLFVKTDSREEIKAKLADLQKDTIQLVTGRAEFETFSGKTMMLDVTMASMTYSSSPSIMVIVRPNTDSQESSAAYQVMASELQNYIGTDALTGLPLRHFLEKEFGQRWKEAIQSKMPVACFMIDIDGFRTYNTVHGLQGGDLCLQWIAEVLTVVASQYNASIARGDGGKFIIVLSGVDVEQARQMAEVIRQSVYDLQIPMDPLSSKKVVTVSVGANVKVPNEIHEIHEIHDLTTGAEIALFSTKGLGSNEIFILN